MSRVSFRRTIAAIPAAALVLLAASAGAQEIVRPGDELLVVIPEVGGTVERVSAVSTSGEVSLGIYGSVRVAGLSVSEAEDVIREHLSRYLRRPSGVEVTLERRQRVVLVTGQVVNPGLTTLEGSADPWLAIQQAGGAAAGADLRHVVIFRDGEEIAVDIRAYLTRASTDRLPELLLGDTIFVPAEPGLPAVQGAAAAFLSEDALASKLFVLGAVVNPGVYDRTPYLNPLTALVLAGGPAPSADLSSVRLITMTETVRVDLQAWMLGDTDAAIELPEVGGAILYVPTRRSGAGTVIDPLAGRVLLMGAVTTTGPMEIDGPTPLVEVLGMAGGYAAQAELEELHLIRQRERYSMHALFDFERYVEEGGGAGSVMVHPGDVLVLGARPETTVWEDLVSGISDLALISTSILVWVDFVRDSR